MEKHVSAFRNILQKETGVPCVMNIWIGDGYKDIPADRMGPRMRYKDSIEQIIAEPHDPKLVKPCVSLRYSESVWSLTQRDQPSLH